MQGGEEQPFMLYDKVKKVIVGFHFSSRSLICLKIWENMSF